MQDKIFYICVLILLAIGHYQIKCLQEDIENISQYIEYLNSNIIPNDYSREED